jgi:hypothetical protein
MKILLFMIIASFLSSHSHSLEIKKDICSNPYVIRDVLTSFEAIPIVSEVYLMEPSSLLQFSEKDGHIEYHCQFQVQVISTEGDEAEILLVRILYQFPTPEEAREFERKLERERTPRPDKRTRKIPL